MIDHDPPPGWASLSAIFNDLGRPDHPLYDRFESRKDRLSALETALATGRIPMRGHRAGAFGLSEYERIEGKLATFGSDIRVSANEVELLKDYGPDLPSLGIAVFKNVQADRAIFEQQMRGGDDVAASERCGVELGIEPDSEFLDKNEHAVRGQLLFSESDLEAPYAEISPQADMAHLAQWLRENTLLASPVGDGRKSPFPESRLPELERFVLDFDRKQEIAGESRSENPAWAAAQKHFAEYIITRDMVRAARTAAGCRGKPGIKPIHAVK